MSPVRPVAAAASIGALLLATGCGIATTGVIEAGPPGTVKVAAPDTGSLLYFVAPEGRLVPVVFVDRSDRSDSYDPLRVGPNSLIDLLAGGPDEAARAAGLRTELPARSEWPKAEEPRMFFTDSQSVRVELPITVKSLSAVARLQLVCTAVSAVRTGPETEVALGGPDGRLDPMRCVGSAD
ncbi:hypothetical protein [Streptomyces sp. NBC_01244]|uniref:hypothetical protein n=1 Tax=Streptomyces sp. NBC_01244 TaxID=2903797 RepID=UPI002E1092BD|nr:hypothetical protein OG247_34885 [Streptomyces sp. NBC_01244]